MDVDRKSLNEIIAASIKCSTWGALVPDQLIFGFIDQCTCYCLIKKWLRTDSIAQWLSAECDFPPDEIKKLFREIKGKAREKLGVEVLLPGESLPPEASAAPRKAPDVRNSVQKKEAPKIMEDWGLEWQGVSDEPENGKK